MTMTTLDKEVHDDLQEIIEDSVEYICDKYMMSGELAWIVVETIATAKLAQLKGLID